MTTVLLRRLFGLFVSEPRELSLTQRLLAVHIGAATAQGMSSIPRRRG